MNEIEQQNQYSLIYHHNELHLKEYDEVQIFHGDIYYHFYMKMIH